MKVSVKTLKGLNSQIDVEPTDKILDVKKKIHAQFGAEFDASTLKLIHSGRVLVDDKTVADYSIKENEFLVVMPNKAAGSAPAAAPAAGGAGAAAAAAAAPTPAAAPAATTPAAATSTTPAPAAAAAATSTPAPSAAGGIAVSDADIQSLTDMGFPRDQAARALRAAFGNRDRAAEYLFSGIPASALADAGPVAPATSAPAASSTSSAAAAPAPAAAATSSSSSAAAATPAPAAASAAAASRPAAEPLPALSADSPLAALAINPNFLQLRAVVQQRPELLPAILQQLAEQQPEMVQLINQNQEDFYILLNSHGGGAGGVPPGAVRIQLTEAEGQAIERLCALGFDRQRVLEAYLACDKDENLAANYLFNQNE